MLDTLAAGPGHGDPLPVILLSLPVILVGAKLAGEFFSRRRQSAVLAELAFGIALGNLALLGGPRLDGLRGSETFAVLAELGAVLLLFHVGLESRMHDLLAVGGRALLVACIGVVTPMLLGFGVGELLRPEEPWMFHAFLGSMLAATSVGITARVLKDAGKLQAPFARIILGAAVIDDVLGLLVLAVISGLIGAAAAGTAPDLGAILGIVAKGVAFLAGALAIGSWLAPRLLRAALALRSTSLAYTVSLAVCFGFSYLALVAGLAPIVGAFAAGLVLDESHMEEHVRRGGRPLSESLAPLVAFLVPLFFVRMGMLVDLRAFASPSVLGLAALLTAAAIAGKLACGAAAPPGVSGLTIGLGMMPRGEVGLIFASIGAKLVLEGRPVIDDSSYAAAVFMVTATTLLTPPLLLWSIARPARTDGLRERAKEAIP